MIPVECPHCEATFQLNADVVGKAVRCPECKDVFVVPVPAQPVSPAASELPYERIESQPPPIPEIDQPPTIVAPAISADAPPASPPPPPVTPAAPIQKAVEIPTAAPILKASSSPAGPKEVDWSDLPKRVPIAPPILDAEPAESTKSTAPDDDDTAQAGFVRRRRKSPWPRLVFFSVMGLTLLAGLGGVIGLFVYLSQAEDRQRLDAEEAYSNGNFSAAKVKYEQLMADYPGSSAMDRYRFFAALSDTQDVIGSVATRENPQPSTQRFQQFVAEYGTSPFAQPETGFGSDILQAGSKLCDAIADHAAEHLKTYRTELKRLKTVEEELLATEKAIALGREQFPTINKFREKEGASLESQRKRFDELEQGVQTERKRLAVLAPFRLIAEDPTAEKIEKFELALTENNLQNDIEAKQMVLNAERRLRELIGPQGRAILAQPVPEDPFPPLLFASAPAGSPKPRSAPQSNPETVFAVARGILYALDAQSGQLLWGVRIGSATSDLRVADVPVRVLVGDGAADWVLVPSDIGGRAGLTARLVRTGEPVWYQRLEAGPAGRPIVVGGRVYLPLSDKLGTVAEFDLITGTRNGELSVRQPLGGGLTVVPGSRPGENFLVVPGDARRVFLFEIGRIDDDGNPLPPRAIRVLLTEHPRNSLRGEPLVITSFDDVGPRLMILAQVDGGSGMKLRAFPMPPLSEWVSQATAENQPTPKAIEVTAPGWAWFPPTTDGERIILATDAGAFVAYGVAQIGNLDKPLFNVPGPKQPSDQDSIARSQVVYADEDSYWAVLNGQLVRLRTIVDSISGLRIEPVGPNRTIGEPVHRAQLRLGQNLGVVVTRTTQAGTIVAHSFDLDTGEIRWQRRLGITAAGPSVVSPEGEAIIADEDGAVYSLKLDDKTKGQPAEAVLLAEPFADIAARASILGSQDGSTTWIAAPVVDQAGQRLRVRKIVNGQVKADTSFPLADALAGHPVALGDSLAVPIRNGYVYRTDGTGNQLTVGPLWRGAAAGAQRTCYLESSGNQELLVTDGNIQFSRWRWPSGPAAKAERLGGPWQTRDPINMPPVLFTSPAGDRLIATDTKGVLYLFDAGKRGDPIRRWRNLDESSIPPGPLTERLVVIKNAGGTRVVGCVDGRHFFALDAEQPQPAWVTRDVAAGELPLLGWVAAKSQILATESTGRLTILNGATGEARLGPPLPLGFAASDSASRLSTTRALLPLADGSMVTIQLSE